MKKMYTAALAFLVVLGVSGCGDDPTGIVPPETVGEGEFPFAASGSWTRMGDGYGKEPSHAAPYPRGPSLCPFTLRANTRGDLRSYRTIAVWRPLPYESNPEHAWRPSEVELDFPAEIAAYISGFPADGLTIDGGGVGSTASRARVYAQGTYPVVATHRDCVANGNIHFKLNCEDEEPGGNDNCPLVRH